MMFALMIAGAGFTGIYILTIFLNFFVALKSPPNRRATWTVGISYVVVSIATIYAILAANEDPTAPGRFPIDPFVAPLLIVPGALLAFFLRRWEYRKGWVAEEDIDENVSLANDDWRFGLAIMVLLVAVITGRVLLREWMKS